MLKGRLGLETARVPQADRHGLLWLARGRLVVETGTLKFVTAGYDEMPEGSYLIPYQMLSCLILQPGVTISHDALRLAASHGVGIVASGTHGVRRYASLMPTGPAVSARARRQVERWADPEQRVAVARRMYAWRLGEVLPGADLTVLRGIEGARVKESYKQLARKYKIRWHGRRYDRADPLKADMPNQAINHVAAAVIAASEVAVASAGIIPQLGFIHEHSGISMPLDIADLYREKVTVPVAFQAVKDRVNRQGIPFERLCRQKAGRAIRKEKLVASMIDRIKELFDEPAKDESEEDVLCV